MQQELRDTYPLLRIGLVGLNERGQEPGNAAATAGLVLPWLQDVADPNGYSSVFALWQVALRDVVILDGSNAKVGVYNLNAHNLAIASNYDTLREMLVDAAMASQLPWRNADRPLDVNNDGSITPLDALIVINRLNASGAGPLSPPLANQPPPPFYDTSGDNQVTALDALRVINHLNSAGASGSGEGEGAGVLPPAWLPTELNVPAPFEQNTAHVVLPRLALSESQDQAPIHEQVEGHASVEPWQASVDLVLAGDASGASRPSQPSGMVPAPSELWELDPWWFAEEDLSVFLP